MCSFFFKPCAYITAISSVYHVNYWDCAEGRQKYSIYIIFTKQLNEMVSKFDLF